MASHAEDIVITDIMRKWRYQYDVRDLYIIIWKQNAKHVIRPVFCCQWCKKRIHNSIIPANNVKTISELYMSQRNTNIQLTRRNIVQSAITSEVYSFPLIKIIRSKNTRRTMIRKSSAIT